jgi:hypothetical protein
MKMVYLFIYFITITKMLKLGEFARLIKAKA